MRGSTGQSGSIEYAPIRLAPRRRCDGRGHRLDEHIVAVRRLLKDGKRNWEIAAALGVSASSVNAFIRRRGLVRPYVGSAPVYREKPDAEPVQAAPRPTPKPSIYAAPIIAPAIPTGDIKLTVFDIVAGCANYHGLTAKAFTAPCRVRRLAHARWLAMYLARVETSASLPKLGTAFGGKDHTTVLHGLRHVAQWLAQDDADGLSDVKTAIASMRHHCMAYAQLRHDRERQQTSELFVALREWGGE